MKTLNDLVIESLNNMSTADLIAVNNTYCQINNYSDDEIYRNDEEFFDIFFEGKPMEVARATFYGDYKFPDDYVKFNGYGNLESLNNFEVEDFVNRIEDVAQCIIDNQQEFDSLFDFDELESQLESEEETED